MDELIDIVDRNGNPTGESALKSEIHTNGHYHNTAHIWFYNGKADILLAQRAKTKTICPLLWDVSVAGHVDAGETVIDAALRETQEEIGLTITENDLYKIGVFPCFQTYENGIIDNEFHHTYISKLEVTLNQLIPQQGEVESLKYMSIKACLEKLDNSDYNSHFISKNKSYYEYVFNAIAQLTS